MSLPRHRVGERFLRGPIPWGWLLRAMRASGSALRVAMMVWYRAGFSNWPSVVVNLSRVPGASRGTASRGLRALERAGLVRVVRRSGRKPLVTIIST